MGALHARVAATSAQTELGCVIDPDESAGRALAARYSAAWAPDITGLHGCAAVIVATPTELHREVATCVLELGLPLLLEKPLADRLADSEAIVELSAARDVPLMCGLLERFNPGVLTARQAVTEPLALSAVRHSPYVSRIRTGVTSDLLLHDVDIALRVMGGYPSEVVGVTATAHPESASEDTADALLRFPGGAVANLSASRMSQRKIRSLAITEHDRLIEVDLIRNAVTIFRHVLGENTEDGLGYRQQTVIDIPHLVSMREPLAAQLDLFVDIVRGRSDADEERATLLAAHRVIEQVRQPR